MLAKTVRLVYDKRVLKSDFSTVAYGTKKELKFPGRSGDFDFLGNMFPAKILFEGKTFNSAEALVQWGKFPHLPVIQNEIRYAKTPFWSWKGEMIGGRQPGRTGRM